MYMFKLFYGLGIKKFKCMYLIIKYYICVYSDIWNIIYIEYFVILYFKFKSVKYGILSIV